MLCQKFLDMLRVKLKSSPALALLKSSRFFLFRGLIDVHTPTEQKTRKQIADHGQQNEPNP